MGPTAPPTCLVVDDELLIRWSLVRYLEARGADVRSVASGELALALLRERPADFLITDIRLPGMDGLELADRCRELPRRPAIVFITGSGVSHLPTDLDRLGVLAVIEKPLMLDPLGRLLAGVLRNSQMAEG